MSLTIQQIENLAGQYYPKIASAIMSAFIGYMDARALMSNNGVIDLKERTCGSMIHDLLKVKLKAEIGEDSDVLIGEFNGIFGMIIQGQLFIRFNKVDKALLSSGHQSKQRDQFINNQLDFDGIDGNLTPLTAGYYPDRSWTAIKNIYLVWRAGDTVIWNKDLTSEVKQTTLFQIQEEEPKEKRTRVSVKKDIQKPGKTGTDDL